MGQEYRVLLAFVLSMLLVTSWQSYKASHYEQPKDAAVISGEQTHNSASVAYDDELEAILSVDAAVNDGIASGVRANFENDNVIGSFNLIGARIDNVRLKKFFIDLYENKDRNVDFLHPSNTKVPYFMEIGWLSSDPSLILPTYQSKWSIDQAIPSNKNNINVVWVSPQGNEFKIHLALSDDYMFEISQEVVNKTSSPIVVKPYQLINRKWDNDGSNFLVHEGAIGVVDEKLLEISFKDIAKHKNTSQRAYWAGFADKYWLSTIIPNEKAAVEFKQFQSGKLQASFLYPQTVVNSNASYETKFLFYSGAKDVDILEKYMSIYNIPLFDKTIDFGLFYIITKPILKFLHYSYQYFGNFGIAIIVLTLLVKLILTPLSYKSLVSMNRLKDLQPKIDEIKKACADDSKQFQTRLLGLYKAEKINPLSSIFPILLQAPVFFALYKVLCISIEMRHAPLLWWIHDLSAPDPTTVFNLFGLIPWIPPQMLMIGAFPIFMALTMHWQQLMNPPAVDSEQAYVMKFMPLIFLFMFSGFPVGLVLYWSLSNLLSMLQQYIIKRYEQEIAIYLKWCKSLFKRNKKQDIDYNNKVKEYT